MTLLDEVADHYGWFAERYRWPPTVVDEQPAWVIARLPLYARAWDEAVAEMREKAQADAKRSRR